MKGIVRDFSQSNIDHIEELIQEEEDFDQNFIVDFFDDTFSSAGDIRDSLDDIDSYHKDVIDDENIGKEKFEKLLKEVEGVDQNYAQALEGNLDNLTALNDLLHDFADLITPNAITVPSYEFKKYLEAFNRTFIVKTGKLIFDLDPKGEFGADQGSLSSRWSGEKDVILDMLKRQLRKKYGEHLTDEELNMYLKLESAKSGFLPSRFPESLAEDDVQAYLEKLNSEGCGYAAAINIILLKYSGREKEFEEKYGISYYDKNGNVNFDELLLSFYLEENDKRNIPFTDAQFTLQHPGATGASICSNIEDYTSQYDEKIIGERISITETTSYGQSQNYKSETVVKPEKVQSQLDNGKVITVTCLGESMSLLYPDGSSYKKQNMHTVTIVGYDENTGKFIVTSWGNQYLLDSLPMNAAYYAY
ncbi:C39 family peptidase [Enterococcus sp. BWM-S5]|uniref:C39 family peptidase n=1 Tax=Enterococcus larvae TaxID=2794352 RepID=A0ABS4CEK8_9ENTE|nr:C39 family peptidase [Enterococcus larvae]MBP1045060.1 C39 family peptidase [Enterococcus larvae]